MSDSNHNGEFIKLLKMNYDNLHKSVWEAHKVSWIMTSIFVPIIFTALGYFIKESKDFNEIQTLVGALVIIAVVWFWNGMLHILEGYNRTRYKKLREIEKAFNEFYLSAPERNVTLAKAKFEQYTLKYRKGFKAATLLMALFLTGLIIALTAYSSFWKF